MPEHTLIQTISVALGGAIGASLRYFVALAIPATVGKPQMAILLVNVAGCFLAGFLATVLASRAPDNVVLQLFLITGLLGGFTTFSAFSLDTLRLASEGHAFQALSNMTFNLFGSVLAAAIGWYCAKALV